MLSLRLIASSRSWVPPADDLQFFVLKLIGRDEELLKLLLTRLREIRGGSRPARPRDRAQEPPHGQDGSEGSRVVAGIAVACRAPPALHYRPHEANDLIPKADRDKAGHLYKQQKRR